MLDYVETSFAEKQSQIFDQLSNLDLSKQLEGFYNKNNFFISRIFNSAEKNQQNVI